jgi:hypothetical protein
MSHLWTNLDATGGQSPSCLEEQNFRPPEIARTVAVSPPANCANPARKLEPVS